VRHVGKKGLLEPDTPDRQALGMATWAEVSAFARKRQQELVLAGITAHACETVFQDPAGLELLDHFAHHRAPVPPTPRETLVVDGAELVEMIVDEAIQR
jgi:hypothetical protein